MLTLTCLTPASCRSKPKPSPPTGSPPLSLADIAALPVHHGNTPATLGDFFTVAGDPTDADLLIEGDCSRVKWLGANMAAGRLTVRGSVGTHLGSGMAGGTFTSTATPTTGAPPRCAAAPSTSTATPATRRGRLTPAAARGCAAATL